MKDLKTYILEASAKDEETKEEKKVDDNGVTKESQPEDQKKAVEEKKIFSFNLEGLDNVKDTIKKFEELDEISGITTEINNETVTLTITKEGTNNVSEVSNIIKDFIQGCNQSGHRASNETYAQKLATVEKTYDEINNYVDQVKGESEEE